MAVTMSLARRLPVDRLEQAGPLDHREDRSHMPMLPHVGQIEPLLRVVDRQRGGHDIALKGTAHRLDRFVRQRGEVADGPF